MAKIYILPDGEEIDLSKIESIGELKSIRSKEFRSLGYWYFTILFKDGTSEEIQAGYYYSDWVKVKIELQIIRGKIIQLFNNFEFV
jgi:hypothetical protein